ncbi:small membrane protein YdgU [Cedecea lapagei]
MLRRYSFELILTALLTCGLITLNFWLQ